MEQKKATSTGVGAAGGGGDSSGEREVYRYTASSLRLKTNEEELFELVELSEVPLDKELFKVILELLKLNVAPATILQVLKTLRAQATQSSLPPSLHGSRASSRSHSPAPVRSTAQPQPSVPTNSDQLQLPSTQRVFPDQSGQGGHQTARATQPLKEHPKQGERHSVAMVTSKAERTTLKSVGPGSSKSKHAKGAKHKTGQSKTIK